MAPGIVTVLVMVYAAAVAAHGGHDQPAGTQEHGNPLRNTKEHADHIIDELSEIIKSKPKEEMTEKELQFHYFKLHDFDNNNKLDGTEIVKAMTHHHDEAKQGEAGTQENRQAAQSDEELTGVVDAILATDDTNKDGYVDFLEFMKSNGDV